jgi:hypothetical protein
MLRAAVVLGCVGALVVAESLLAKLFQHLVNENAIFYKTMYAIGIFSKKRYSSK